MELLALPKRISVARKEFEAAAAKRIEAERDEFDAYSTWRCLQTMRRKLIKESPQEPTLMRVFERIGKPFVERVNSYSELTYRSIYSPIQGCVEIWFVAGDTRGMRNMDGLPEDYQAVNAISFEKLLAIWKIDWWLRRNRNNILEFLYHPSRGMAKKCVERAKELGDTVVKTP